MEQINKLINQEIDKQVQARITTFIEHISRTYDISMKVLLRDLTSALEEKNEEVQPGFVQCLGVNQSNRKRCKFGAGPTGYCKKHRDQYRPPPSPSKVCTVIEHTHTMPPLFDPNCPVCVKKDNKPKDKLLITI